MNKKIKDLCITEMVSPTVGDIIWQEARKELLLEIKSTLNDLSKDSLEMWELNLLIEDYN